MIVCLDKHIAIPTDNMMIWRTYRYTGGQHDDLAVLHECVALGAERSLALALLVTPSEDGALPHLKHLYIYTCGCNKGGGGAHPP